MTDAPTSVELLDAVVVFLQESIQPQLDAAGALDARIAASLLQMVRRELLRPSGEETDEVHRLQSLVGDAGNDLTALNRRLCEQISQGRLDPLDAELRAHLWAVTCSKLAIDQPHQSTYVRVGSRGVGPVEPDAGAETSGRISSKPPQSRNRSFPPS